MFDIDSYKVTDAIQQSQDYKLIRVDGFLYLFPADTDFSDLNKSRTSDALARQSVLAIRPDGTVLHNRHGRCSG